jgi:hypothetical protein
MRGLPLLASALPWMPRNVAWHFSSELQFPRRRDLCTGGASDRDHGAELKIPTRIFQYRAIRLCGPRALLGVPAIAELNIQGMFNDFITPPVNRKPANPANPYHYSLHEQERLPRYQNLTA